ncbi:unnamed protein product [Didymodactylos carnosus]|uniref:Ferroptosis suppressor protein 1 n=1 Tax=Didymodactylos carnosus TaxID=1234261 RepID=A0A815KT06_9BILA|nr:unnamed protein product [Didymodactylos carnosus]CAF1400577.1 unnamed protein product [Didymodactylos carnosus]CAF4049606.1 unnamed protein product [Didymodactylos carnosus]CAF4294489.1 unnamed protein product [Didymodactylos carnosus]
MGVTGSQQNTDKKPVVIIIGGGYGGVEAAKKLDKSGHFFVILIDRKSYFLHNIAALRASVENEYARQIMIPYDKLLNNGCVIQAEVAAVTTEHILIHGSSTPMTFDYLIIATGSSYAFPAKVSDHNSAEAYLRYKQLREKIEKAQRILIVGGGPVGCELAGEIAEDFKNKQVTLIHSQTALINPNLFNPKFCQAIREQLESLDVKVLLNERIDLKPMLEDYKQSDMNYLEGEYTVNTDKQTPITSDLIFICTGTKVNNRSLDAFRLHFNAEGRINVNNHLQVPGYKNIFAIGDISSKETKMAFYAGAQASYVASVIKAMQQNKSFREYTAAKNRAMLVTIGRNGGVGQLPTSSQTVVGKTVVKLIKSKGMISRKYWSIMNQKYTPTANEQQSKETTIDREFDKSYNRKINALLTMDFTENEANDLLKGLPNRTLEAGQDYI